MVSARYLSILLVAIAVSSLVAWYGHFRGQEIGVYTLMLSVLFSIIYVPLVVIRLPVFRKYYVTNLVAPDKVHHNFANHRVAPVAVGLVSGVTIGLILLGLDFVNPAYHALCGAVAATTISFYYEPRY
jgi:hypothetical protein